MRVYVLSLSDGFATSDSAFGVEALRPIFLDQVDCNGAETSIVNCSHDGFGQHDCSTEQYAGVACVSGGWFQNQNSLDLYSSYNNITQDSMELHDTLSCLLLQVLKRGACSLKINFNVE